MNPQGLIDLSFQVYVSRNLMSRLGVPKPLNRFGDTILFLNQEYCVRDPFMNL
jgi:hypothetical protein